MLYSLFSLACFVLWILALIDCLKSNNPDKIVWVIVIIMLPFLGAILYYAVGRKKA